MDELMEGDSDTGSESVLESELDPEPILALARKKAPETHSAKQPPKAKAAPGPSHQRRREHHPRRFGSE